MIWNSYLQARTTLRKAHLRSSTLLPNSSIQRRQTGSWHWFSLKLNPKKYYTYSKLLWRYQVAVINSCREKLTKKSWTDKWTDNQTDEQTPWPPHIPCTIEINAVYGWKCTPAVTSGRGDWGLQSIKWCKWYIQKVCIKSWKEVIINTYKFEMPYLPYNVNVIMATFSNSDICYSHSFRWPKNSTMEKIYPYTMQ